MPLSEPAPAKVNLSLRVLGRRPDGYHEIESLVVFADLADEILLEPGGLPGTIVEGPFAAEVTGGNIVDRTLALLVETAPRLRLGSVRIAKHIPVAAGLGGGSADVAATLRAVRRANPEHAAEADWTAIAARLGADVVACLTCRPLIMRGTGTVVEPIAAPFPMLDAVLVNPRASVPPDKTRAVYQALAAAAVGAAPPVRRAAAPHPGPLPARGEREDHCSLPPWSAAQRGEGWGEGRQLAPTLASSVASTTAKDPASLLDLLAALNNDLEAPARRVMPAIDAVMAALAATPGCRLVRLSGSGPTCFGLYARGDDADRAASSLTNRHASWWVQRARLGEALSVRG